MYPERRTATRQEVTFPAFPVLSTERPRKSHELNGHREFRNDGTVVADGAKRSDCSAEFAGDRLSASWVAHAFCIGPTYLLVPAGLKA